MGDGGCGVLFPRAATTASGPCVVRVVGGAVTDTPSLLEAGAWRNLGGFPPLRGPFAWSVTLASDFGL